ncbi:MAG: phenylacetic acid degradation protein PaaN [Bacteroidota bacterium]
MSTTTATSGLYAKHEAAIQKAIEAVHARAFFAHYPEPPSKRIYGETANADGLAAYQAQVGNPLELRQDANKGLVSDETSPYTREKLNIEYPVFDSPETYVQKAQEAAAQWREASVETRAGILMEALDRVKNRFFELAYATMHTTGQAFVMSFQASGPHSNDRALETLALGVYELGRFPQDTFTWTKPMGKFEVNIEKRYHNVPKGIALAIGVSTFPVWNTLPGVYASLITGNPVIAKPHPQAIYPMALVVQELQLVLQEEGFDAHVIQLAVDSAEKLITTELAEHPAVKIIDYTGGNTYGDYIESLKGKTVFTEKAGVNSVIIDSVDNLKAALGNLAFSVSMYSGQMCTCPQNFFIPKGGIQAGDTHVSYEEIVEGLTQSIQGLVTNPKAGVGVTGTIQSEATHHRAAQAQKLDGVVKLGPIDIAHPDFPDARIATPIVVEVGPDRKDIFGQELFGPIVLIVPTDDTHHSVALAKSLAMEKGAITCTAHTTDPKVMQYIETEMAEAFTPVSFNLTGMFWVNQHAGFSDFHVTGGNPAGNAALTSPEFVRQRFITVGTRVYLP